MSESLPIAEKDAGLIESLIQKYDGLAANESARYCRAQDVAADLREVLATLERQAGCDCAELCSMGPTCPGGMLAGLDGAGCWRVNDLPERQSPVPDVRTSGGQLTRVLPPGSGRTEGGA